MKLRGVALVFGRIIDNGSDPPFVVLPGAVRLEGARMPLISEHDYSRSFALTCRGTLSLQANDGALFFEATIDDQDLEDDVLSGRRTQVSALYDPVATRHGMHAGREVLFFEQCFLREVSVVQIGACPGTACWLDDAPDEWLSERQLFAKRQWILRNWRGAPVPPAPKSAAPPSLMALMASTSWHSARAQQLDAGRILRGLAQRDRGTSISGGSEPRDRRPLQNRIISPRRWKDDLAWA